MSCNWPLVTLSEVTSRIGDGLHGTPKYDDNGDYYFINGNNLSNGKIVINEKTKRTDESQYLKHKKDLNDRTLLVSINGTLGNIGTYQGEKVFLGKSACYLNVLPNVNKDYVMYVLTSKHFQDYIHNLATGSTIKNVGLKLIREYEFQLPDIKTQDSIANVLVSIDSKMSVNQQTNQTLEEMAQAIFKSWFVDFDPVKAKMNGEQPEGMDAATASLFPEKLVESELGLIPEGWEAKPLGDYLTIKRGGSPRPIKEFIVPDGYPWTKIADATANDNPYIFKTKEFIKEEGLKKTVYLKKGTLILSNSATPGLPRFLDLDACIHDGWLHFPEKKHFTDSYLYQLFLHIRKHLVSQGNGSVFTNLKTDILRNQVVLVPPKELIDIYEKHAGKFLETVKAKSIESNQLAKLRDTLLPKLLSGEIDLAPQGNQ